MSDKKVLYSALVAAIGEMPDPPMNNVNPHFKSRFADLKAIMDTAKPVLARHGLAILCRPISGQLNDGSATVGISSMVIHESGESTDERAIMIPLDGSRGSIAQVAGSDLTYLTRYSVARWLGMVADPDDDGNTGTSAPGSSPARSAISQPKPKVEEKVSANDDLPPKMDKSGGEDHTKVTHIDFCDISEGGTEDRPWKRYAIKDSDGQRTSTFDRDVGEVLEHAHANKLAVKVWYRQNQKNPKYTDVYHAELDADDDAPF